MMACGLISRRSALPYPRAEPSSGASEAKAWLLQQSAQACADKVIELLGAAPVS